MIAVIDNTEGNPGAIAAQLARVLYDQPTEAPKPEISRVIAATIEEQGVEAGIEEYRRLRAEAPDDYDFAESELNNLGYFLLRDGDVELLSPSSRSTPSSTRTRSTPSTASARPTRKPGRSSWRSRITSGRSN